MKLSAHHRQPSAANPCIRNCCLDGAEFCLGCGRHLQEILKWHSLSQHEREAILERAKQRFTAR